MNDIGRNSELRTDLQEECQSRGLWGARKMISRKMNSVWGKWTADESSEKRAKLGVHLELEAKKEEEEWSQGEKQTADGF